MNVSLDDNEEVFSDESKEESKDIESHPAYFNLLYPKISKNYQLILSHARHFRKLENNLTLSEKKFRQS